MRIESLFIELLIFSVGIGTWLNHESKYIYKLDENMNRKKIDYYIAFEKEPFGEGVSRYCFIGEIKNKNGQNSKPNMFPTGKCVVKVFKNGRAYKYSDVINDLNNTKYSQKVSNIFNSKNIVNKKLIFADVYLTYFDESAFFNFYKNKKEFKENEYLIIEPYIDGKYEKFVSNGGWITKNIGITVPLFMHWNWVYSKGQKLVTDIQGVKTGKFYELTDPAVQSINQEYGNTDLGAEGLVLFLLSHKHNKYCKSLPWPNDIEIKKLNNSLEHLIKKKKNTSYRSKHDENEDFKELYLKIINSTFNTNNNIIPFLFAIFFIVIVIVIVLIIIIKYNNKQKSDYENKEKNI